MTDRITRDPFKMHGETVFTYALDGLSTSISLDNEGLMVHAKVTTRRGVDKMIKVLGQLQNRLPEQQPLETPLDKTEAT